MITKDVQPWSDALTDFKRGFTEKLADQLASLQYKIDSLIDIEKARALDELERRIQQLEMIIKPTNPMLSKRTGLSISRQVVTDYNGRDHGVIVGGNTGGY